MTPAVSEHSLIKCRSKYCYLQSKLLKNESAEEAHIRSASDWFLGSVYTDMKMNDSEILLLMSVVFSDRLAKWTVKNTFFQWEFIYKGN